ncbi:IS3 family transposase, partial [Achromobacter spanius]|uniref:IS3 family transposase n=1 Tax=Achromobacter spanius TaxID=217203 RepID=UPI003208C36C
YWRLTSLGLASGLDLSMGHLLQVLSTSSGVRKTRASSESFFSNLKNELTHHQVFHSREHARLAIFNYIEVFYNRQRIHQGLGYRTPAQVEAAVP